MRAVCRVAGLLLVLLVLLVDDGAARAGGGALRGDDPGTETARECMDGVDNDGDGLLDCADADCMEAAGRAWAHCPRAPGACIGCSNTCVEGVCVDLGIPPRCHWWSDGCNLCEVFEGRLRGCTMKQCDVPGPSFCAGFTDGTVCTSPGKCGAHRLGEAGLAAATDINVGASGSSGTCAAQLALAAEGEFAPQCDDAGNFMPVQCWVQSAECWCVDPTGAEIADTRIGLHGSAVLDISTCVMVEHATAGSGHR